MRSFLIRSLPFVLLLAGACVYRQSIPQGNFFTAEDAAKLEEGMTREQVQFVMGTPMIADPFHPDRWDYVFYVDAQDDARDFRRRVTIFFDGDTVTRIEKENVDEHTEPTGDEGIVVDERTEPTGDEGIVVDE